MRYPFAALVGQEQLKLALLLNAIDPSLGGVLVCGEKGTAKSTAARALVDLLPTIRAQESCPYHTSPDDAAVEGRDAAVVKTPVPFVEMPLGATEDRVFGTLDLQAAQRYATRSPRATLPGSAGDPWEQTLQTAQEVARQGVSTLVLDTDQGFVHLGRAREVAEALGGEYRSLDELSADALALEIQQRRPATHATTRLRRANR